MNKGQFNPFQRAKENRDRLSIEHRRRFQNGDENAIFRFLMIDQTNVKEPWVLKALLRWLLDRNAKAIKKLGRTLEKPCYTDLTGPERHELERNLPLLGLVFEAKRATGWSEAKTIEVFEDVYMMKMGGEADQELLEYAHTQYPKLPIEFVEQLIEMDLLTVRGEREPVSESYFKDLVTKRLKKYASVFPYLQR